MSSPQMPVLQPVPRAARFSFFRIVHGVQADDLRQALADLNPDGLLLGLGPSTLSLLGASVPGMRGFPALEGPGLSIPSTQQALMLRTEGEDAGEALHRALAAEIALAVAFELESAIDAFKHREGRDLTGYVDGTENPTGEDALRAALCTDGGPGIEGSTFVAIQQWEHDLGEFRSHGKAACDHMIGRSLDTDEELDDAPPSAHVKRTAQESFEPAAFILRASMPWVDASGQGLVFVAHGHSLDAYEALLRRMVGLDDGITDALFRFSTPQTGGYYWCPPMDGDAFDLRALQGPG